MATFFHAAPSSRLFFFKTSHFRNTITLNELMLEKFDYYK